MTAASSRERIARHRATQRARGLRPVVMWLPDVNSQAYRDRVAEDCRRLRSLSADTDAMAAGFEALAAETEGWR